MIGDGSKISASICRSTRGFSPSAPTLTCGAVAEALVPPVAAAAAVTISNRCNRS